MVVGQPSHRSNLLKDFVLFEKVRRAANSHLGSQVNLADRASQDDPINTFFCQIGSRLQNLNWNAFILCVLDMLAFTDTSHEKTPLSEEKLGIQLRIWVLSQLQAVDAMGGNGEVIIVE
jgi:hypothetical protein